MAISFKRHRFTPLIIRRFTPLIIRRAVWLYLRFTLSLRDVEDILFQEGIDVSYETIRCWVRKFGPQIAQNLRQSRPDPSPRWHLDEMVCKIRGKRMFLWRAVDDEGEVLGQLMHRYRDAWTATKFLYQLLMKQPVYPERIVTDKLGSYARAAKHLNLVEAHSSAGRYKNNRAENSHLPVRQRERKMQGFKSASSADQFLASFSDVHNTFSIQRHKLSRRSMKVLRQSAYQAWNSATGAIEVSGMVS